MPWRLKDGHRQKLARNPYMLLMLTSVYAEQGTLPENRGGLYGAEKISENVWEWCLSDYDKPQLDARKENLRKANNRVLLGGSWRGNQLSARGCLSFRRSCCGP